MSDLTTSIGVDVYAFEAHSNRNYASTNTVQVGVAAPRRRFGFVRPTVSGPALYGRTVLHAELSGRIQNSAGNAQVVTAFVLIERFSPGSVDWGHRPAATAALGATAAVPSGNGPGDVVTWDVTAVMQAVADGAAFYGWRLTSPGDPGLTFWSYDSGNPAWELTVTLSEFPEQPTQLRPDGGAVTSTKPVLGWDGDAGAVIPQAEFQILIYDDEESLTPVFDSGWVVSPDPEFDLAASSYVPVGTPWWTVQTKSSTGALSEVSDRASFVTAAKPVLVVDTPTGGVIGDPSPEVAAHFVSGTMTMWRGQVTSNDRSVILYDTGVKNGAMAFTVPVRSGGRKVLTDGKPSWLYLRAWDDVDRAAAVGDPTYVDTWIPLTWANGAVPTPTGLTVMTSGDPRLTWQWTHSETAEAYLLQANGVTIERVDPDDIDGPVAGVYTYTDRGTVDPLRTHALTVRGVEGSQRSPASNTVTFSHVVEGVWLLPETGEPVKLNGTAVDSISREDYTATYQMQDGSSVDIIYGRPGLTGTLELSTDSRDDAFATLDAFDALTPDDTTVPIVQLVWGSKSLRVRLQSPHYIPAPEITPGNLLHRVRFGFVEEP